MLVLFLYFNLFGSRINQANVVIIKVINPILIVNTILSDGSTIIL